MHFTFVGIVWLLVFLAIPVIVIIINRLAKGETITMPHFSGISKPGKKDGDTIECFNIYEHEIRGETMLKKSVCKDADIWEVGNKKMLWQKRMDGDKDFSRVDLPDEVHYPPERAARMIGCEPLRKLKSLKFNWYEHLAPFAPVIALGIVIFIFYLMAN